MCVHVYVCVYVCACVCVFVVLCVCVYICMSVGECDSISLNQSFIVCIEGIGCIYAPNLYMGWLRLVGCLKLQVSFVEYSILLRALLQKRPLILRSLLIKASPYPTASTCARICAFCSFMLYIYICIYVSAYEYTHSYVSTYIFGCVFARVGESVFIGTVV